VINLVVQKSWLSGRDFWRDYLANCRDKDFKKSPAGRTPLGSKRIYCHNIWDAIWATRQ